MKMMFALLALLLPMVAHPIGTAGIHNQPPSIDRPVLWAYNPSDPTGVIPLPRDLSLISTNQDVDSLITNPPAPQVSIVVQLKLSAVGGTNGQPQVSGELLIKNLTDKSLTIQDPRARQVLAFLVFDPLGNPVAPAGLGKADPPAWPTHTLPPYGAYTHRFEGLNFITGSAHWTYNLSPGKTYRVVAVYRPAGPRSPGLSSPETVLEMPK